MHIQNPISRTFEETSSTHIPTCVQDSHRGDKFLISQHFTCIPNIPAHPKIPARMRSLSKLTAN